MKCAKGLCLVCEKVIASPCPTCKASWQQNEHHTMVELQWSNGSKMSVPVCIACSKGPVWTGDKTKMTEAIWSAWDELGQTYDRTIVLV